MVARSSGKLAWQCERRGRAYARQALCFRRWFALCRRDSAWLACMRLMRGAERPAADQEAASFLRLESPAARLLAATELAPVDCHRVATSNS